MSDVMTGQMLKIRGGLFTDDVYICEEFVHDLNLGADDDLGWERGVKRSFVVVEGADDIEGMMEVCQNDPSLAHLDMDAFAEVDFGYHIGLCDGPDNEGMYEGIVMSSRFDQMVDVRIRVLEPESWG